MGIVKESSLTNNFSNQGSFIRINSSRSKLAHTNSSVSKASNLKEPEKVKKKVISQKLLAFPVSQLKEKRRLSVIQSVRGAESDSSIHTESEMSL